MIILDTFHPPIPAISEADYGNNVLIIETTFKERSVLCEARLVTVGEMFKGANRSGETPITDARELAYRFLLFEFDGMMTDENMIVEVLYDQATAKAVDAAYIVRSNNVEQNTKEWCRLMAANAGISLYCDLLPSSVHYAV